MTAPSNANTSGLEVVAWRPVVGFEGLYEVSSSGDIRNARTGRVQSKCLTGGGYVKAEFWRDGVRKQTSVHRTVAEAFIPLVAGMNEVNHIDGDKQNNNVANLEWSDRRGNNDHAFYVLGHSVKAVMATDPKTGAEQYFPSIADAARSGYKASGIYAALNGIKKTHGGKRWSLTQWRQPAALQQETQP